MMMFSLGAITYDSDAQAFFSAAGITDDTQKNAVNQLVLDLKAYSLWSKIHVMYPFVGGSASSHSYNLKNPANFQITWSGGITHSATGVTGNGTNGYGDTGFNVASNITLNNSSILVYCRNHNTDTDTDIGCGDGTTSSRFYAVLWSTNDRAVSCQYNTTNNAGAVITNIGSATNASGFWVMNRRSSSVHRVLRNNSVVGSSTGSGGSLPSYNVRLFTFNNGGSNLGYQTREQAFTSISTGLTDTEETNFNTAVQAFQTALSRNV